MTTRDNIIFYTITAVVFIGIVVCTLLFHNTGQPTNGDSERENISTIVIAFSPFLTAAATIVLVGITWWYVRLTREILKATNKPEVILFLHHNSGEISICVQNIGTGYASDIKFTGDLSFKPTSPLPIDKTLEELPPFKDGINYLGAGHKIYTPLCTIYRSQDLEKKTIDIVVSYKDSTNSKVKPKSYSFKLDNWEDTSQFISPQNDEIENHLNKISKTLAEIKMLDFSTDSWPHDNSQTAVLERIADALDRISQNK